MKKNGFIEQVQSGEIQGPRMTDLEYWTGAQPVRNRNRWDASTTTDLNRDQWIYADGQSLNHELLANWEELCNRCEHEAERNSILKGVIATFCTDIVGGQVGFPHLEIQTDGKYKDWAQWVAEVFDHWRNECDWRLKQHLHEMIEMDFRQMWTRGEVLHQHRYDGPAADQLVTFRIQAVNPRKLRSPISGMGISDIFMGVQSDSNDRAIGYWIDQGKDTDLTSAWQAPTFFPRNVVTHYFNVIDPEQKRGIPLAASCLQVIRDIEDADDQILDAIRAAADYAVLLESANDQMTPVDFDSMAGQTVPIRRRQITTAPPGYKATQLKPEHPSTGWQEYRDERLRHVGLPVGMPLMNIKRDAKGMNFSQAKFGNGGYWRHVAKHQNRYGNRILTPYVKMIANEAWLAAESRGLNPPPRPGIMEMWKVEWRWSKAPIFEPRTEAIAQTLLRAVNGITLTEMAESRDTTVRRQARLEREEREIYEDEGLVYPSTESTRETMEMVKELATTLVQEERQEEAANA